MTSKKDVDGFKLKLTGSGVSIERTVSEIIARQIVGLVIGGGNVEQLKPGQDAIGLDPSDTNTPKAFMVARRPTTDIERVTCLAYFLTHARNVTAFKTKELTDLNMEAAQPRLSNPSATARNAVGYGFLAPAGGGRKQITPRGEALVKALPDREKVKAALDEHRIRKKPRKRTARKQTAKK
jgi:hypothetical protein